MKTILATSLPLLLSLFTLSESIQCYSCIYSDLVLDLPGTPWDSNDPRCKLGGEDISSELLVSCPSGYNICAFIYTKIGDEKETYARGCDSSINYLNEVDMCNESEEEGIEVHTCICQEDGCNGAEKNTLTSIVALLSMALVVGTLIK